MCVYMKGLNLRAWQLLLGILLQLRGHDMGQKAACISFEGGYVTLCWQAGALPGSWCRLAQICWYASSWGGIAVG